MKLKRVGVFGGSFDPIHNGHLEVAVGALCELGLDEVLLMVSPENPLKTGHLHAPELCRLEMAKLAVEELPPELRRKIIVSDYEFNLPRPSFTIDTLRSLAFDFPDCKFSWIVGADNLTNLSSWRDPERILADFGLIVYPRPGEKLPDKIGDGIRILRGVKEFPYSSTDIRKRLAAGDDDNLPVAESVKSYLERHPEIYRQQTG